MWLCCLGAAQGLLVATPRGHAGATPRGLRHRPTQCVEAADDDLVSRISDVFWENKRAQLDAEMDASLRMLQEFAAREDALLSIGVLPEGAERSALPVSDAEADIELLEAQLVIARYEGEVSLQKTGAFWIGQLAQARAEADARIAELTAQASAAEARATAAEARAAEAEAASKGVSDTLPELRKLLDQLDERCVATVTPTSKPETAAEEEEKQPAAKADEKEVVAEPVEKQEPKAPV